MIIRNVIFLFVSIGNKENWNDVIKLGNSKIRKIKIGDFYTSSRSGRFFFRPGLLFLFSFHAMTSSPREKKWIRFIELFP